MVVDEAVASSYAKSKNSKQHVSQSEVQKGE